MRYKRDLLETVEYHKENSQWWFDEWQGVAEENDRLREEKEELQEINQALAATVRLQASGIASLKGSVCSLDSAPDDTVQAIEELLGRFVERWTDTDGEQFYTVTDHYYRDTDFFKDLFNIIDTSNSNEGK